MVDAIFLYSAIIGGTVLASQLVLMALGLGDGGDADVADVAGADGADFSGSADVPHGDLSGDLSGDVDHAHGHPTWTEAGDADMGHPGAHWFYEMLSLRTLGAAVTFFGLAGKTAQARGMNDVQSVVIGLLVGAAAMYGVYWLFKQVYKVQHSGNENIRRAIGLPATVYVPIPANRDGLGKVTFRLQDRTVEYQAITSEADRLRTGEEVIITEIVNSDTVCVAREPQLAQA
jgi:hypothetical protein